MIKLLKLITCSRHYDILLKFVVGWGRLSRFPAKMTLAHTRALLIDLTMEVKRVGTFPVILLKLATPPLPPQTKLDLEQNGWKWVLFLATTLLGEVGGWRDEPKAEQKIVLRSRVYGTINWKGFFTQSQVLLSSIVAQSQIKWTNEIRQMLTIDTNHPGGNLVHQHKSIKFDEVGVRPAPK